MAHWDGLDEAVAIADAGTFVGAARNLNVSTSHISRAVRRLEQRIGMPLFLRTTRKVSLTDLGRSFVEQSRRLIQERDDLLSIAHDRGEAQGELRVTCSISLGERFLAPLLRRYATDNPALSVTLDLSNHVVDIVGEGYDIGIRTGQVSDARLVRRQVASRTSVTCASPAYLASAGVPDTIEALADRDCLRATSATWHFLDQGLPRTFTPVGRWRCNSGTAVVDAALAGMGICQLPLFYVRDHLDRGALKPVLTDYHVFPEPIWVVLPARRHTLPKISAFVALLESNLQRAIDHA